MHWPEHIRTTRLTLRPPHAQDAHAIFDGYAQSAEATRYLVWRPHTTIAETHAYLARCGEGWRTGNELTWALTQHGDDRLIGMIAVRPGAFKPGLGYVLAPRFWSQGFMTEAVRAIVDIAFADATVWRVWAVCDIDNRASARVLEKAGMQHEGTLRRWIVHPNVSDRPRDVHCYARVRSAPGAPDLP